jgi:hypothetical protein
MGGNASTCQGGGHWTDGFAKMTRTVCSNTVVPQPEMARAEMKQQSNLRISNAYKCAFLNRSAFPITVTELNVIAALAIMGLSSNPKKG